MFLVLLLYLFLIVLLFSLRILLQVVTAVSNSISYYFLQFFLVIEFPYRRLYQVSETCIWTVVLMFFMLLSLHGSCIPNTLSISSFLFFIAYFLPIRSTVAMHLHSQI